MFYNNLLYFLVIIFVFSADSAPLQPTIAPLWGIPLFGVLLGIYYQLAGRVFAAVRPGSAASYFTAEKKLSILAIIFYLAVLFGLDLKYYLQPLSFGGRLPILENLAGLGIFFVLLCCMWLQARRHYVLVFGRSHSARSFLLHNIRANLPVILPWLILSFLFDLLAALPYPAFQELLRSAWGDLLLFSCFAFFLAFFLPPLIRRLWGCLPLPDGPLLRHMQAFCRRQGFASEILLWPLFEGQVVTAGIMGLLPRFRYLLVTPALLSTMSLEELESVLAHEIGHVKKRHLFLYIFLFLGFSLLAGALSGLLPFVFLGSEWFYWLLEKLPASPENLLALLGALPLLALMLLYFRFIFGYFIRNFERQADAFVFHALGTALPLISSFEKIARLSGNIREEKNWHHFGIGERIRFLEQCELDPGIITRHDRKVRLSLLFYAMAIVLLSLSARRVDTDALTAGHEQRYMEAVLEQKLRQDPDNGLWLRLLADLMQEKKMEEKAIATYRRAQELEPLNAEIQNNLAWLLLTAQDPQLRDAAEALILARSAAALKPQGYILDTLATAFWANWLLDEAIRTELEAARLDPGNRTYYLSRITTFRNKEWQGAFGEAADGPTGRSDRQP